MQAPARVALSGRSFVFLALTACTGVACGPSARSVHEGTMHFEHCYRLDEEAGSNDAERLGCWRTWSERHARFHAGDRTRYAERRLTELAAPSDATHGTDARDRSDTTGVTGVTDTRSTP